MPIARHGARDAAACAAGAVPHGRRAGLPEGPVQGQNARRGPDLRSPRTRVHGRQGRRARSTSSPGLPLPAFIHGGGQESNFRSGTENLPGICGFGAAVRRIRTRRRTSPTWRVCGIWRGKCSPQVDRSRSHRQRRHAPHIVNLSLPGLRSQGIINCLQSGGIYVSAGSACSKGHRSHVLDAMHLSPAIIDGSIRVSFSRDNTEADVDALCAALLRAKKTLKG